MVKFVQLASEADDATIQMLADEMEFMNKLTLEDDCVSLFS